MSRQASDARRRDSASMSHARVSSSVPGGASTPRQLAITTSRPLSRMVGTSLPGMRSADDTASTRMRPPSAWAFHSPKPEMPAVTCPPITATAASPPPEWAT